MFRVLSTVVFVSLKPNAARDPGRGEVLLAPLRETRSYNFIRPPAESRSPHRRASQVGRTKWRGKGERDARVEGEVGMALEVRAIKSASGEKKERVNSARTMPLFITTANLPSAKFRQFPAVTATALLSAV